MKAVSLDGQVIIKTRSKQARDNKQLLEASLLKAIVCTQDMHLVQLRKQVMDAYYLALHSLKLSYSGVTGLVVKVLFEEVDTHNQRVFFDASRQIYALHSELCRVKSENFDSGFVSLKLKNIQQTISHCSL